MVRVRVPRQPDPGPLRAGPTREASASGATLPQGRGLAHALAQEVQLGARRTRPWRTTSIFSTRGLLTMNVRSTPTPLAILRTVMERAMPPPLSFITVPSKTWMRSLPPSTTRAETLTVSPEASSGRSVRIWSATISSRTFNGGGSCWSRRATAPLDVDWASADRPTAAKDTTERTAVRTPAGGDPGGGRACGRAKPRGASDGPPRGCRRRGHPARRDRGTRRVACTGGTRGGRH